MSDITQAQKNTSKLRQKQKPEQRQRNLNQTSKQIFDSVYKFFTEPKIKNQTCE